VLFLWLALSQEHDEAMGELGLCFKPACELAELIRRGELSARELVAASIEQIERTNPQVNALITLTADRAIRSAAAADERQATGGTLGLLHGLCTVHKDLFLTRGVRTTFGSPLYKDHVPQRDSLIVARQHRAGAIMLGKTNTPEFGAGSQTFNALFGATRNPYDLSRTCGGSSGGSAVALACGMSSLADGTDVGGSLRNPAAFCNVVGFRPTPASVPGEPDRAAWRDLEVVGPMGRTVQDVTLLLFAVGQPGWAGPHVEVDRPSQIVPLLEYEFRGTPVAWCSRFAGLPFDRSVVEVLEAARGAFESIGCRTEEACPDLAGADMVFKRLRAKAFEAALGWLLDRHRDELKDTVVWNIEEGRKLTVAELEAAEARRRELQAGWQRFFTRYRFLILPTTQVPPFDIEQPYVTEIASQRMGTYIDWMASCYLISVLGVPAISVPAGFTADGLPIGLQIVGPAGADLDVLRLAYAYQEASGWWQRRPALAEP